MHNYMPESEKMAAAYRCTVALGKTEKSGENNVRDGNGVPPLGQLPTWFIHRYSMATECAIPVG